MKHTFIPLSRIMGDLAFDICGQNKVSLDIGGVWSNSVSQTLISDQGCLYGYSEVGEVKSLTSFNILKKLLAEISIVPFQNDSRYAKYATKEINEWIKHKAFNLIHDEFLADEGVTEVSLNYHMEGEDVLFIRVKLFLNDYAINLHKFTSESEYIGEVINVISLNNEEGVEFTVSPDVDSDTVLIKGNGDTLCLIGVDCYTNGKHLYKTKGDKYILSRIKHNFNLEKSSPAVNKVCK